MLVSLDKVLAEGRSGLSSSNAIHVRLFYVATEFSGSGNALAKDDGLQLRSFMQSAIASWGKDKDSVPAVSVVPVQAIDVINGLPSSKDLKALLAMQVLKVDPVHMETEIWMQKDRQNA
jgi:hypothetical protein